MIFAALLTMVSPVEVKYKTIPEMLKSNITKCILINKEETLI